MQVNNINPQTNFKSKFIPSALLEQSFDGAVKEQDRFFVKALNTLLSDGKNDVLELKKRTNHHLSLYVNGEIEDEGSIFLNYYRNVGADLIKKYAKKQVCDYNYANKYSTLSKQETELVKEDVNLIKLLSESFENGTDFIEKVQVILNKMKTKLDNNTTKEISELKKLIFNK